MDSSTKSSTPYNPAYPQSYQQNPPYPAYGVEQRYPPQPGFIGAPAMTTTIASAPPHPGFIGAPAMTTAIGSAPPQPAPSYNPRFPPQNVPPAGSNYARRKKNSPQNISVNSVGMLFMSGGMNWAWSCTITGPIPFTITTHIQVCWFIGAIIGAILSAIATRRIHTKLIYMCSSLLVTIGGILFLAQPDNAAAITAARYLDGIGVGMALVPALVLAGEEVVKEERGYVAALLVAMTFSLGILLDIIYASTYSYYGYNDLTFSGNRLHGLLSALFGLVSIVLSYFLVIESPVYYLLRNQEDEALDCMRRLQRPFVVSFETYELLEELKRYVVDNKENGGNGLLALSKLCLYQGLITLSFSSVMITGFTIATFIYIGPLAIWPYMVLGVLRYLGAFIASFVMDSFGRKKLMIVGCIVCGSLAIGVGSIYSDTFNIVYISKMSSVMYLIFALQFFVGFFLGPAPVYNTEAYPLAFKPYFIAIGFIVEMLVQIIIAVCPLSFAGLSSYFITMGALYIVFFFFSLFTIPETKQDTLRVAQGKFRGFSHTQMQW